MKAMSMTKAQLIDELTRIKRQINKLEHGKSKRLKTAEKTPDDTKPYKELADSISDVFFAMDKDLRYTYWNKASKKLTGISAKDAMGKTIYEFFPDSLNTRKAVKIYRQVIKTKKPMNFINEYRLKGKIHIFEINAYPLKNGVSVFVKDITEHRQVYDALRKERDFSQNILNTVQAIILLLDANGKIVSFNPYMEEISGYRLDEVRGKDWFSTFLPKEKQDRTRTLFKKAISDIKTRGNIDSIIIRDGREKYIEWYDTTIKDEHGQVIGLLTIGQDVTKRKKAEDALKKEATRRKILMDISRDGIAIINQKHELVEANQRFAEMLGYTLEEVIGLHTWDWEAVMTEEKIRASFADLTKTNVVFESRHRRKDGTIYDVEVSASGTKVGGEPMVITISRDITERKRAEKEIIKKMHEVERINKLFIGRELRMIELKKEVNSLLEKIRQPKKYQAPEQI